MVVVIYETVGCNLTEDDNLSQSVSLNMKLLRIFKKRFVLLKINDFSFQTVQD